jgi:hypothetical protein
VRTKARAVTTTGVKIRMDNLDLQTKNLMRANRPCYILSVKMLREKTVGEKNGLFFLEVYFG